MVMYHVGADNITGRETEDCNKIAQILQGCGHQAKVYPVGPNKEGLAQEIGAGGDDILVFLCGGVDGCTEWSIKECVRNNNCCKVVFAYAGWTSTQAGSPMNTKELNFNFRIGASYDAGQYLTPASRQACINDIAGRTHKEYIDANSQYIGICYSKEGPEDLAKQICSGTCGQGGGGTTDSGIGGGILIPDKTFWGLIKQIMGGIDGLFIIANNMAYLLSFKDYYEYRDKYDEFIPILETSDILDNTIEKGWTTDGFYNVVEVSFEGGIIRQQHDVLVEQYGEHVWYYDFPEDDEETAMAKADALLSAHVRDYALDIRMSVVYNPNITAGGWLKVPKTITKVTKGEQDKQDQKTGTEAEKKEKKRKEDIIDMTEMVSIMQEMSPNNKYSIKTVSNNKDEEYEVMTEESEYEIFFVQGYSLVWDSEHAPIMDIHLKYGPDTPEDPVNATIGGGGVKAAAGGKYGNDCFSICDICIENCAKILPAGGGRRPDAEEYIKSHEPDPMYLAGRARQGSTYVNDVAGKTSPEAYTIFRNKFSYACYWDSCDGAYPCCEDLWTKATACNCGDGTRMLKVLMDATGTPCYGIHVDGHYFNAVQVNGQWETLDATRGPTNSSCNFPDGNWGAGSNACGAGWCSG